MIAHCIICGCETTPFDGEPADNPQGICEPCRREEDGDDEDPETSGYYPPRRMA